MHTHTAQRLRRAAISLAIAAASVIFIAGNMPMASEITPLLIITKPGALSATKLTLIMI